MDNIKDIMTAKLNAALDIAEDVINGKDLPPFAEQIEEQFLCALEKMSQKSAKASTGFTNLMTSLAIKAAMGDSVDVRYHQVQIQNQTSRPAGFNFRGHSESVIAVWLSQHEFNGAKSGWQTRTFERPKPYMMDYDENIGDIKHAFLTCYDQIETNGQDANAALAFLCWRQLQLRDAKRVVISAPNISDVLQITKYFSSHFGHKYKDSKGASRLPVLVLYAIYSVLVKELARYQGTSLKPLEAHSAADSQTGALGDIEVIRSDGTVFEALEIKHGLPVTEGIVESVKKKIRGDRVDRYYILTTYASHEPDERVRSEVEVIKSLLGCQLIVNGVIPSIKYYLRLLSNPGDALLEYAMLLGTDPVISFEHKDVWNRITTGEIM